MRRLAACALLAALLPCQAAVHLYNGALQRHPPRTLSLHTRARTGVFTPLNDAYVFRGGREGMFRSHRDKARPAAPRQARWREADARTGCGRDCKRRVEH